MAVACSTPDKKDVFGPLRVSDNQRYFADANGNPFFWLGDTGWLLFTRLNREDSEKYLDDRKAKGFNVIQVMMLHTLTACNIYGDSALVTGDLTKPVVTDGSLFTDSVQYDFWDHVDYVVNRAAEKQMYIALVPLWGSNVKDARVTPERAAAYGKWVADRYKNCPNVIWLNGGDIKGSDSIAVWKALGENIAATDTNHLITYHPRGRNTSSRWFQNEKWLDFNMCQSGHRTYAQDNDSNGMMFGEDNWRFIANDLALTPLKPTLDGEPSYEEIPYGLHDTLLPRWNADEIRRYAYWSVFAGASGFTYGHNSVMQFFKSTDKEGAYGAITHWPEAINAPGAQQMKHIRSLMESRPYFDRIPDQTLIASNQGEKHEWIAGTRGNDYAFIYTWTGKSFGVNMGKIDGDKVKASWFDPRTGQTQEIGAYVNSGVVEFDAPGDPRIGNDWVLVLDKQ